MGLVLTDNAEDLIDEDPAGYLKEIADICTSSVQAATMSVVGSFSALFLIVYIHALTL
ncbi:MULTISPECIES: hypothetical protein [Niastella]|uniref:hypothetical protein n=1 Tax=Niastella TaxID=354354 RepID=UPI001ADA00FA|nr:hypothetical protein [Niastella soli]